MKQFLVLIAGISITYNAVAQKITYAELIKAQQQKYVNTHGVVKGKDRKYLGFYPANASFKVECKFERSADTATVAMKTSGTSIPVKDFKRYGKLIFTIHDTLLQLTIYKSSGFVPAEYKNYLFIPFTDLTSGDGSYGGGRYIDILTTDIKNGRLNLDLNKAYNPYCAYTTGYNCPIPPRENNLPVAVKAGEKDYGKEH